MSATTHIGRYEILRPLGTGAMGIVYLARDPHIDREVALKTVRFDQPGHAVEEAKARFLKEARISGRLQHPHIVTVYDVGEDQGTLYLAMEYVKGGSLAQRLFEPVPLSIEDRIRIVVEVAEALGHAHERGVIHRDIKPANILLTENLAAKVTDFGIGKFLSGDTDLTSAGQMVGSPAYMSPEQIRGEKVDARSDIFSLGVVLYQTLTLRKPFPADTLTTLVYQILHEEPPDPLAVRDDLPPELSAIVRRCLAKNRDQRYSDAREVAAELGRLIGLSPTTSTMALSESKVRRAAARMEPPAVPPPPVTIRPPSAEIPTVVAPLPVSVPPPPAGAAPEPPPRKRRHLPAMAALVVVVAAAALVLARRAGTPHGDTVRPTPGVPATPAASTASAASTSATAAAETTTDAATPVTGTVTVLEQETPTPAPTRTATPRPSPTATPTPVVTPTPTPPLADVSYSVKRSVKVNVSPDQARVFVDGKFAGIVDDWDDSGGGSLLTWNTPGRHRLRIAYPGYRDLVAEITVTPSAREDKVEIEQKLEKGSPSGPTGPEGKLPRPTYKTTGPVRFEVEPPDATISVNGRELGLVSSFREQDLQLADMAVYDVALSAPGYATRTLRIIVSPVAGARAVVKERLKRQK